MPAKFPSFPKRKIAPPPPRNGERKESLLSEEEKAKQEFIPLAPGTELELLPFTPGKPQPIIRVGFPPFDRERLWATITNLYPDIADFFPVLPNDAQFQEGVNSLIQVAQEDMDTFLGDLRAKGRNEDISYLLSTVFGASPGEIEEFFSGADLETTLNKVLPGISLKDLDIMLKEDVDVFITAVRTGGRTQDK